MDFSSNRPASFVTCTAQSSPPATADRRPGRMIRRSRPSLTSARSRAEHTRSCEPFTLADHDPFAMHLTPAPTNELFGRLPDARRLHRPAQVRVRMLHHHASLRAREGVGVRRSHAAGGGIVVIPFASAKTRRPGLGRVFFAFAFVSVFSDCTDARGDESTEDGGPVFAVLQPPAEAMCAERIAVPPDDCRTGGGCHTCRFFAFSDLFNIDAVNDHQTSLLFES